MMALSSPLGLYHVTQMPFGLHGAAATLQRLMDNVLQPVAAFALPYINDIIVFSQTWGDHLAYQHLCWCNFANMA